MSWRKIKLKEILKQYRIQHIVQDHINYKQVTISKYDGVIMRGTKIGKEIGRKRQFVIDLKKFPNTLMLVRQGVHDGSIGIAPIEVDGCIATENMPMFSIEGINLEYLRFLLKSPYFYDELKKIETSGSAQKAIHEKQILEIEIPLPDLKEQEELVKELSKLKNNGKKISTELNEQLNLIKQLRQAFLREAMEGKLVKNSTNNKTGQQLLEQTKAEKAKLITEKKIKKEKAIPSITEEEIPFEIPKHWTWCKIGELTTSIVPNRDKPLSFSGDIPWITQSNFSEKSFHLNYNLNNLGLTEDEVKKYNCRIMPSRSIIMSCVGRFDLVCLIEKKIVANQQLHCFVPHGNIEPMYLVYALKLLSKQVEKNAIHTTIKYINKTKCESIPIPLPPLREQKLIVDKLVELMKLCDNLEKSVKECQDYNDMLLQEVLRDALRPKENTKTISIDSKKIENPLKTILAGHIINLNNTTDFGRVKFQKLLFLIEYICKIDFDSNYIKKVAGPYDDNLIKSIEADFNRMRFFNVVQEKTDNKRVRYHALAGASELKNLFLENFSDDAVRINNTILKFRPLSWGECELIATLYAVWNNRIIKNEPITDELLYSDFMEWDKQKKKYHSVFYKWLFWMKEEKIIPDGWGKYIEKPNSN